MRRSLGLLAIAALTAIPASAAIAAPPQSAPIIQEWNFDGTPAGQPVSVGSSKLTRSADGVSAIVRMEGLRPGGVYTFWWIVVQGDGAFPDDIFVANGSGRVIGRNGRTTVRMSAATGQPGITGFAPDGINELTFAALEEPESALVRIEVAYHGQAEDAGADLGTWLYDFWTGSACPPVTPNPNPAQPHCPVYYAATHQ